MPFSGIITPFGRGACEYEADNPEKIEKYRSIYVDHTRFSGESLDTGTYLIVGRRGTGKTALTKYYHFQSTIPNAIYVDIDEPRTFAQVASACNKSAELSRLVVIRKYYLLWDVVIWTAIFNYLRSNLIDAPSPIIRACASLTNEPSFTAFIKKLVSDLSQKFLGIEDAVNILDEYISSELFTKAREAVVSVARERPILTAIDSMEQYDLTDDNLMSVVCALVEYASDFNINWAEKNIMLKVFLPAEVYPHLRENIITNVEKFVRDPLTLHWRPKDLIRVLCHRLHAYLAGGPYHEFLPVDVDWDDYDSIYEKMWIPFFGESITSRTGMREGCLSYILRHSQLRPRQLIKICNSIARDAIHDRSFPRFSEKNIRDGIKAVEDEMATEIINSFQQVYKNGGEILYALKSLGPVFSGHELDRHAKETAALWEDRYDKYKFRRLVAELGAVGVVRQGCERSGHLVADFEYFLPDRLFISNNDRCVIHPLFYRRFHMDKWFESNGPFRVLPFPEGPHFDVLKDVSL